MTSSPPSSLRSAPAAPAPAPPAKPYIGGQAVLEGVMMRAPTSFAIVVRRRDGSLLVRERPIADARRGVARWPLVRGVASLVESLRLGSEALRFSAETMERDFAAEDAAAEAAAKKKSVGAAGGTLSVLSAFGLSLFAMATRDAEPAAGDAAPGDEGAKSRGAMGLMLVVAVLFLIALPQLVAALVNRWLHLGLDVQSARMQAITGGFKLLIVVGYLLLIRRVPDIRRVFQYHGAEHKTISTYEAGETLTVDHARAKTTLHPRCGTTFLVMVAIVSILVFTALGATLPRIRLGNAALENLAFFAIKLPALPLIAAVTFELQRVFARFCTTGPLRVLLWPGFLVQKITTIEPDDTQLEVALGALRATLFREERAAVAGVGAGAGAREVAAAADEGAAVDVAFASYADLLGAAALRPASARAA